MHELQEKIIKLSLYAQKTGKTSSPKEKFYDYCRKRANAINSWYNGIEQIINDNCCVIIILEV